ncbi:MAG: hypothetical protein PHD32_07495 [Eubacteriales bacterium]|nr:hypothetical protein [Eubacteriales bacterium]
MWKKAQKIVIAVLCAAVVFATSGCSGIYQPWEPKPAATEGRFFRQEEPLPEGSADYTASAAPRAQAIQETYAVAVADPQGLVTPDLEDPYFSALEDTLAAYGASFVQNVVNAYVQDGYAFVVAIETPDEQAVAEEYTGLCELDDNALVIHLYASDDPDLNGVTVETFSHEFAHAVHYDAEYRYGEDELLDRYSAFNNGIAYDLDAVELPAGYDAYFPNDYAYTDYYEDVASCMEVLITTPQETADKLADEFYAPLRRKIEFLRQVFEEYYGPCDTAFAPLS